MKGGRLAWLAGEENGRKEERQAAALAGWGRERKDEGQAAGLAGWGIWPAPLPLLFGSILFQWPVDVQLLGSSPPTGHPTLLGHVPFRLETPLKLLGPHMFRGPLKGHVPF